MIDDMMKKVAAIHDLSGFGRSSLTAIIPTLSSMGIQVCPVPTAILSNHTGGFEYYSFLDLTDYLEEYILQWKRLNLSFDCIYSGFLGSPAQAAIVSDFISYFGHRDNLTLVDPVLGDNGELYSSMNADMIEEMKKLMAKADIITPNFTEAGFLLDRPQQDFITTADVKVWLKELSALGPKTVIITSVPGDGTKAGRGLASDVVAYDRKNDIFWKVGCQYIPASYPGTGDAFASVLIGSLLSGDSLPVALDRSVQFIAQCIKASYGFNYPKRNGVLLERELDILKMPVLISGYEML